MTHLLKEFLHNFGPVVHGENNVFDASSNEGFDLMDNHGLVAKFDERFRERQGLDGAETIVRKKEVYSI